MKKHTLHAILLTSAILPCALRAQTNIFTDTFENRVEGSAIHGSTSSDGNVTWTMSGGSDGGVVLNNNGNKIVDFRQNNSADQGLLIARSVSSPTEALQVKDGIFEFDFYYLQGFDENTSFILNYRMASDYQNLSAGGVINGYQLRLTALNSTEPDSINWFIQTDPNGSDPIIASGSFDVADLVVSGNTTPGSALSVKLELNGTLQQLSLNDTIVASFNDSSFNNEGEGAFNFISNVSRERGLDNVSVSVIPEPSMAAAAFGILSGLVVWLRGRSSRGV